MVSAELPNEFKIVDLTRNLARRYDHVLASLANTIPLVEYTADDVLADNKHDRCLYGKWIHGLVVFWGDEVVGFVSAYERISERNEQYPANTLYISELVISKKHRGKGVARVLMERFFEKNSKIGMKVIGGELNYSLQTNSADWNKPVIDFYLSLGFLVQSEKFYSNRVDSVLRRS